ncbi:isoprenylcysteine carboxylmethyltransferase family protein [uncultured Psychromonas sp.]|uniref:methyltransferase family protein n=1 Tax=uncultured Psychromonas sp. TaxID=173974 RepID=UPI00260E73E9|nr:isoprenylcysteine carboxylmethyltransferase family protein [uncultured Psychromonas sp.]
MQRIMKYPPLVTLLFMLMIYLMTLLIPFLNVGSLFWDGLSGVVLCASVLVILSSGWRFKKAKTTVDPTTPEKTTRLVTSGVYRYSRNPMYLGLLGFLIVEILLLGNLFGLALLPLYMMTMNKRFIKPEETALESLFGQSFIDYKQKVRRWL